jgi:hypothetical protein
VEPATRLDHHTPCWHGGDFALDLNSQFPLEHIRHPVLTGMPVTRSTQETRLERVLDDGYGATGGATEDFISGPEAADLDEFAGIGRSQVRVSHGPCEVRGVQGL